MEDWKTPLDEAAKAIEQAKVALTIGDPKTMHEVLLDVPEKLTDLLRSLCAAVNEMD